MSEVAHVDSGSARAAAEPTLGESRWPPALALLIFMGLNVAVRLWLPRAGPIRVPWLIPSIEAILLVTLIFSDPGNLSRYHRVLRPLSLAFVTVLVLAALWATILLVHDIVTNAAVTHSATRLLASGALTWLGNNVAFSVLYWLMDGGGPLGRARLRVPVDFAFTQQMSPELAPPNWRPVFLDYLHLGFTNATAFSPTDVMPLTHRAKYTMLVQSTVALALFGLIVARAVNAF
ncbi:MAG TPA: hypothetical protein VGH82_07080 [Gaiellaceae bacterium]